MKTTQHAKANGTSFKGYLNIDYQTLVDVFGKPHGPSKDGKAQAQWVIELGDAILTIYDYKSNTPAKKQTRWHVGGNGIARVSDLVDLIYEDAQMCANCGYHITRCKLREGCPAWNDLPAPF